MLMEASEWRKAAVEQAWLLEIQIHQDCHQTRTITPVMKYVFMVHLWYNKLCFE
jgi:hypothetical protein